MVAIFKFRISSLNKANISFRKKLYSYPLRCRNPVWIPALVKQNNGTTHKHQVKLQNREKKTMETHAMLAQISRNRSPEQETCWGFLVQASCFQKLSWWKVSYWRWTMFGVDHQQNARQHRSNKTDMSARSATVSEIDIGYDKHLLWTFNRYDMNALRSIGNWSFAFRWQFPVVLRTLSNVCTCGEINLGMIKDCLFVHCVFFVF